MSDYLTAAELADLIGCKPNQRTAMTKWLDANAWAYVIDRNGFPKVARRHRDIKLGVVDVTFSQPEHKYAVGPDRDAFKRSR